MRPYLEDEHKTGEYSYIPGTGRIHISVYSLFLSLSLSPSPLLPPSQSLAQGIYEELQSMVDMYGQESIGNLMPLVVNILENLDSALSDNKDHMTAIEEFTHTNELLMKQYEKEKQRRKEVEEVRESSNDTESRWTT